MPSEDMLNQKQRTYTCCHQMRRIILSDASGLSGPSVVDRTHWVGFGGGRKNTWSSVSDCLLKT